MPGQLVHEKLWDKKSPARSTLYRFAQTVNLKRDPHLTTHALARPFEYAFFGQLWMADFLHAPKIREKGKKRKTYLHAIIDDATRYVVHAGFFTSETTEVMMTELMASVRTHGKPLRFYTDNGACYAGKHLKFACANLGIHLIHTPPGKPRGRGKVERFFRSVRDQFLDGENVPGHTLDGLNTAFREWLASYHKRIHRSLGVSPLQKRLSHQSACIPIPEMVEIEPLFRMKRRCKVYLDNTIRLKRRIYEVANAIPGQRVEPDSLWDLCSLLFRASKQTVAASLILVGDENLDRQLWLYAMAPIRSRLTSIMKLNTMNENETRMFTLSRLKNAEAPADLLTDEAIELIAAYTRGNRRGVMNTATAALEDAYYHNEKNVTAQILYNSGWFNESE